MKKFPYFVFTYFFITTIFIAGNPLISFAQKTTLNAGKNIHPSWSGQSNIYEVNLRQYTASSSIKDFEKSLPRLKKMGVEILWFMPVTPIGLVERKMTPADLGSYYAVSKSVH